jgi:hypothetical protein
LFAQPGRKIAFQLHCRASSRSKKRKTRPASQLVAQHHERQRLFRCEVRRRQQTGAGYSIVLLPFVERQRNARLPKQIEIAEDGATANAAFQGQRISVAPASNLQQTNQL